MFYNDLFLFVYNSIELNILVLKLILYHPDDSYSGDSSDEEFDDSDDDYYDDEEDDNIERFKKIDGYPNYSISNHGRIRSDKFNRILTAIL